MVKKISMISNEMKDFSVCANAEKLTTEWADLQTTIKYINI